MNYRRLVTPKSTQFRCYTTAAGRSGRSRGNQLNHAEFLELILQDELAVRNERLITRRGKAASFREPRTLEDFDWQFNPSIKRKQIFDLATCDTWRHLDYYSE